MRWLLHAYPQFIPKLIAMTDVFIAVTVITWGLLKKVRRALYNDNNM